MAVINDGLVAYYPFSGNAEDQSGNGNHGTVNGPTLTMDRFGNSSSAYSFDGNDDYIEIANSSSLDGMDQITMSVWVYFENWRYWPRIISKRINAASGPDINLETYGLIVTGAVSDTDHNPAIELSTVNSGTQESVAINFDFNLQLSKWYHIVGTYDGSLAKLYVNGKEMPILSQEQTLGGQINSSPHSIFIGDRWEHTAGTRKVDGKLDDIRIYNRVLSENEVKSLVSGLIADSDEDGVIDLWDRCSDIPAETIIDADGCPVARKVVIVPFF